MNADRYGCRHIREQAPCAIVTRELEIFFKNQFGLWPTLYVYIVHLAESETGNIIAVCLLKAYMLLPITE